MSANNNSKGILLIITAMTFFAMQDALIKFIFEKAALYEELQPISAQKYKASNSKRNRLIKLSE